jgi:hypothetical protein
MKMTIRLIVATIAFSSAAAFGAKPPPAPPPPTGCGYAGGVFPSIVFGKLLETASGVVSSWDIYVGNSDGTCAIKVYSIAGVTPNSVSMALRGSEYRIVWEQSQRASKSGPYQSTVKMVRFSVDANQAIQEALPLVASTLYTDLSDTTVAYVYDASISPGGTSVVLARKVSTLIELRLLDISACTPSCPAPVVFSDSSYDGLSGATFGAGLNGTDRIYFTAKKALQPWSLYLLGKDTGCPASSSPYNCIPRLVASMADSPYSDDLNNAARSSFPGGRQIFWPRATQLMVPGGTTPDEVVSFSAYTREALPDGSSGSSIKGVDFIDVANCAASGSGSCLYSNSNEATRLGYNIPGKEGSGGWKVDPVTGASILTMNDTNPLTLNGEMRALDPFGWQLLVPLGPGLKPDGIK